MSHPFGTAFRVTLSRVLVAAGWRHDRQSDLYHDDETGCSVKIVAERVASLRGLTGQSVLGQRLVPSRLSGVEAAFDVAQKIRALVLGERLRRQERARQGGGA